MSRIEVNHYPVANLPEDLRKNFEEGKHVKITIEDDFASLEHYEDLENLLIGLKNEPKITLDEVVKRVRNLRDDEEERFEKF
jgi:hypothetical protein